MWFVYFIAVVEMNMIVIKVMNLQSFTLIVLWEASLLYLYDIKH